MKRLQAKLMETVAKFREVFIGKLSNQLCFFENLSPSFAQPIHSFCHRRMGLRILFNPQCR